MDYYNTSLGIDQPNGNTTVTGWMHDAHLTGMTPGLLVPLPIKFDGLTFKPLDGYVACVMTRTTPGQNKAEGFMDQMIVATHDGDGTTITAHPSQDKWDRIELALVCDRPLTSVANGVGGVQLWADEEYLDTNDPVQPDATFCNAIGSGKFYCRLGSINLPPKATSLSMDNYNSVGGFANGIDRPANTTWWSTHERLQTQKLYYGGVEMSSTDRVVYEYAGGRDGFRPNTTGGWNPFNDKWIYVKPGWYLWQCILTFKPEQTSTDGFYAFQGWFDEWGGPDDARNAGFWADMDVKSASATGLDTAQRIVNKMVYIDLNGWHQFHLAETTLGKVSPMLSMSHASSSNGTRYPQICRLIRM